MRDKNLDLQLAGQAIAALPNTWNVVGYAVGTALSWSIAITFPVVAWVASHDLLAVVFACLPAAPLGVFGYCQLQLMIAITNAKLRALEPPELEPERVVFVGPGNLRRDDGQGGVDKRDVLWMAEQIYKHSINWARREIVRKQQLPSGELLDETYYEKLIATLVGLGLITDRQERERGEKAVGDWNEAMAILQQQGTA